MSNLVLLIKIGGVLHLEILSAGITMTKVLEWKSERQKLGALTRHVIWVHGAFIFLVIAGFGMVSLLQSDALAGAPHWAACCLGLLHCSGACGW